MSEHSRNHHGRPADVRDDRYSDEPSYRETHDEHDYNRRRVVSDNDARDHRSADHRFGAIDDHRESRQPGNFDPDFPETEEVWPETEEVWLKEKLSHISYNDSDLRDIKHTKHSTIVQTLTRFAGIAGILGLIGFLAVSSIPDLSPEEIIAMDGYAGEQKTKTPFNLASLRDCYVGDDCSNLAKTEIVPITSTSGTTKSGISTSGSAQTSNSRNISETVDSSYESYPAVREIPAANSTTTNVATSSAAADRPTTRRDNAASNLVVLQQWSNVRSAPEINGEILTSLAEGAQVTRIGQIGNWIEVKVSGRKQVTGYMHRSTVSQL